MLPFGTGLVVARPKVCRVRSSPLLLRLRLAAEVRHSPNAHPSETEFQRSQTSGSGMPSPRVRLPRQKAENGSLTRFRALVGPHHALRGQRPRGLFRRSPTTAQPYRTALPRPTTAPDYRTPVPRFTTSQRRWLEVTHGVGVQRRRSRDPAALVRHGTAKRYLLSALPHGAARPYCAAPLRPGTAAHQTHALPCCTTAARYRLPYRTELPHVTTAAHYRVSPPLRSGACGTMGE